MCQHMCNSAGHNDRLRFDNAMLLHCCSNHLYGVPSWFVAIVITAHRNFSKLHSVRRFELLNQNMYTAYSTTAVPIQQHIAFLIHDLGFVLLQISFASVSVPIYNRLALLSRSGHVITWICLVLILSWCLCRGMHSSQHTTGSYRLWPYLFAWSISLAAASMDHINFYRSPLHVDPHSHSDYMLTHCARQHQHPQQATDGVW